MNLMTRVRGALSAFATSNRLPRPATGEVGATGTRVFGNLLQQLDYNADWGIPLRYDKIDQMRRGDSDIKAGLFFIKSPLIAMDWEIVPGDDSAQAEEAAALVREDLMENVRQTWDYTIRHALLMLDFGCMPLEKVWERRGGKIRLRKLPPRLPKTIDDFELDSGELAAIIQTVTSHALTRVRIPADKVVMLVHEQEGSDFRGTSILRSVWRDHYFTDTLETVDGMAGEKHGVGIDVLQYDANEIKGDQLEEVKAAGRTLRAHEMQNLTIPKDVDYTIAAPQGTVHDTMRSITHHQQKKFRALFADVLGMGEGRLGSHGLAGVKTDVALQNFKGLAKQIRDSFNCQLIAPWHVWNFGEDVPAPMLKHKRIDTRDIKAWAESLAQLAGVGIIRKDEGLEDESREALGLRMVEHVEEEPGDVGVSPVAGDKLEDTALNGAQVSAALEIVASVAAGSLPRGTGVGMIQEFFQIEGDRAERIMGEVGRGFVPETPAAPADGEEVGVPEQREQREIPRPFRPRTEPGDGGGAGGEAATRRSGAHAELEASDLGPLSEFEQRVDFATMRAALDGAEDRIHEAASDVVQEQIGSLVDQTEAVFLLGEEADLSDVAVSDESIGALTEAVTGELGDLVAIGRGEVRKERARGAGRAELAIDQPLDPQDVAAVHEHLGVRGRAVAERLSEKFRAALLIEAARQAKTGVFDAAVLIELLTTLSGTELRQDVRLLTSEAIGLGREAQEAEFAGDAEEAVISARLDDNTCGPCRRIHFETHENPIEPFGERYVGLTPPFNDPNGEVVCDGRDRCRCIRITRYRTG